MFIAAALVVASRRRETVAHKSTTWPTPIPLPFTTAIPWSQLPEFASGLLRIAVVHSLKLGFEVFHGSAGIAISAMRDPGLFALVWADGIWMSDRKETG